jgi:hypothetical protein
MFDSSLKIKLYFWSILLFVLGTWAGYSGFYWLGILLWVLGGLISIHIVLVSLIRERRYYIESETEKLEKQLEFYKHIQSMTEEEKYLFGLSYIPKEVLVKKDKTKDEGNEFSQTWKSLPIAPYKLKTIAQATINGEGFTVRKWVGDSEHPGLLTRPEWDKLHDAMEKLGMLEPVNEDDRKQGFNWTGFGISVMEQVVRETL